MCTPKRKLSRLAVTLQVCEHKDMRDVVLENPEARTVQHMARHHVMALLLGVVLTTHTLAEPLSISSQLEALAHTEHFQVRGTEHLLPESAGIPDTGTVTEKLKALLKNYNYFVTAPKAGGIREVVITSRLTPRPSLPPYQHVPTTRVGSHHQVEGQLIGPNNVAIPLAFIVDTGASAIVLPMSMTADLGFARCR
jgi:aspartyl protease family protein